MGRVFRGERGPVVGHVVSFARTTALALVLIAALAAVVSIDQKAAGADSRFLPAPRPTGLPSAAEELPALRTRTSRTYAIPRGDNIAVISRDAINYRDEHGLWQPI